MPFTKTFNPGEILTASDVNEHLLNGGYQYRETIYFTSSGSFVKADYPWLRAIRVRCQGAGGGGGGATGGANAAEGGGGGGGGYGESFITDIASLDASVTVTRGAGGAGGGATVNGSAGGQSSFGALVSGAGGAGGLQCANTSADARAGGAGGGATGDLTISGTRGAWGRLFSSNPVFANHGGDSVLGAKGVSGLIDGNGANGDLYGGGASGARAFATNRAGGTGANGIVIVELYA